MSSQKPPNESRPSLIPPVPTTWDHPQETFDWFDYQVSRVVATYIREHPEDAINHARANIKRWQARAEGKGPGDIQHFLSGTRQRWLEILDKSTPEEVANLLEEQSSFAQELRSSTPFVGLPCLDQAWLGPLRREVALQTNAAAITYKQRFMEKRRLPLRLPNLRPIMPDLDGPQHTFSEADLKLALDGFAEIYDDKEFYVVGSMSVLAKAAFCDLPEELRKSFDIDIYPKHKMADASVAADHFGPYTEFMNVYGFCIEGVGDWTTMTTPPGWEQRTIPI